MGSTALLRVLSVVLLVLATITLAGCEVVGDIFKAGVWVGVLAVVVVLGVFGFVVAKISS
jgi:hypothetical protein